MSSSIPPNNLESLLSWIRIFAQDVNGNLTKVKKELSDIKKTIEKEEEKK